MVLKEALTYDDVLLVPKRSPVKTRKEVDVSTQATRNIRLNIPLISANMDSITESKMSIAMARAGGLGVIHQFMPVTEQVKEVLKVKRSENFIIENPYTLTPEKSLKDAKEIMSVYGVKGILVVDPESRKKLVGVLTRRDLVFETDGDKKVDELMTKGKDLITAPPGTTLDEAKKILKQNRVEKLPLVDEKGELKGLIAAKDILKTAKYPRAAKDKRGRLLVGAAVGVKEGYLERAEKLL